MHIYNVKGHTINIEDRVFDNYKEGMGYPLDDLNADLLSSIIITKYEQKNIFKTDSEFSDEINGFITKYIDRHSAIPADILIKQ